MNEEDIDFLISIQDLEQPEFDNACLEKVNKRLQQENKQLKEEIEEYKRIEQEDLKAFNNYDSILTELEEELNIAYKELQPGELVIGQDILKNIQTIIQELKEKYK